jgi:hypothetical protein
MYIFTTGTSASACFGLLDRGGTVGTISTGKYSRFPKTFRALPWYMSLLKVQEAPTDKWRMNIRKRIQVGMYVLVHYVHEYILVYIYMNT